MTLLFAHRDTIRAKLNPRGEPVQARFGNLEVPTSSLRVEVEVCATCKCS